MPRGTQPQVRARFPFDAGAKPVLSSGPGMIAPSPAPPSDARLLARTMVLIPALNEAECIDATVRYWRARFVSLVRVVDNGSTDATAMRAGAAGAEVLAESRRGYGAACWTGLQAIPPAIEWILFSSADGSDQLADADVAAWQRAVDDGFDFILGDRCSTPESRRHLKWIQVLGNRLCCGLIYLGWGGRFKDMGSLRLIRRTSLDALRLEDRGFGWNIEMQVRALERGLRWVELPVPYHPRRAGRSKISGSVRGSIKAAWGMMNMIVRLWWRRGVISNQ